MLSRYGNSSVAVFLVGFLLVINSYSESSLDKEAIFANVIHREIGVTFEPLRIDVVKEGVLESWVGYLGDRDTLPKNDGYYCRVERIAPFQYRIHYLDESGKEVTTVVSMDGRKQVVFWTKSKQKKLVINQFIDSNQVAHPSLYLRDKINAVVIKPAKSSSAMLVHTLPPSIPPYQVHSRLFDNTTLVWVKLPAVSDEVLVNIGKDAMPLIDPVTAKTNFFYVQASNPMIQVSLDKADKRSLGNAQNSNVANSVERSTVGVPSVAVQSASAVAPTVSGVTASAPSTSSAVTTSVGVTSSAPSTSSAVTTSVGVTSSTVPAEVVPATVLPSVVINKPISGKSGVSSTTSSGSGTSSGSNGTTSASSPTSGTQSQSTSSAGVVANK